LVFAAIGVVSHAYRPASRGGMLWWARKQWGFALSFSQRAALRIFFDLK